MTIWSDIGRDKGNSVLQIICEKSLYDPYKPYRNPIDSLCYGTAFIVDIERGLVVTTHHVIENSISITAYTPLLGKYSMELEIMGMCQRRDLALLKIKEYDLIMINSIYSKQNNVVRNLNFEFDDSLELLMGDDVMTLGYPLGESNVKMIAGIVSGFPVIDKRNLCIGSDEGNLSFIQSTVPINPGCSGGPLLNSKGKVVGINTGGIACAQNISFSVSSRSFLSIYDQLLTSYIFYPPCMSIDWQPTNDDILNEMTGGSQIKGIYIKSVGPDSFLIPLEDGDIISSITFSDPYYVKKYDKGNSGNACYDLPERSLYIQKNNKLTLENTPKKIVSGVFDNFGEITCYPLTLEELQDLTKSQEIPGLKILGKNEKNTGTEKKWPSKLVDRKISINEFFNMIPYGSDIDLIIFRGKNWYVLQSKYITSNVYRIQHHELNFMPIEYEIICGMCIAIMTLNHFYPQNGKCTIDNIEKYYEGNEKNKPRIIVTNVFPNTVASKSKIIYKGDIIETVNGNEVITMDDLRKYILNSGKRIKLETDKHGIFICDKEKIISEDLSIYNKYQILTHSYLFSKQ